MKKSSAVKKSALLLLTLLVISHIVVASVFTVTNTSNNAATTGSLPWAVAQVNAGSGGDVINFNTTGAISITAQLTLNKTVTIDGTSAPGYTIAPVIEITNGASVATAFSISAANCTIKGLCITGFSSQAINIASSGNTIAKCYIGIKLSGTSQSNGDGIVVAAGNNTIGGVNAGNLISGNTGSGIKLNGTGNTAQGNIIGLSAAGDIMANDYHGIVVSGNNNIIGGSATGAGNVLSGNGGNGLLIVSQGNTIKGNKIGTNATGTSAAGNTYYGIELNGDNNTIGGSAANEGNVISGNGWSAIIIAATGNTIKGNKLGVDMTGTTAVPNEYHGIEVYAETNTIGGSGAGEGNLISGNMGSGVILGTNGTVVKGNTIGMNAAGTAAIPNGYYGIEVDGSENIIGGLATGEGNFIGGNPYAGINVYGGTTTSILGNTISKNGGSGVYLVTEANIIKGNKIGVDATGSISMPNLYHGIEVKNANNIIGGLTAGEGNTISKNAGNGILISSGTANSLLGNTISENAGSGIAINTEDNIVKGNKIGINTAGTAAAPNVYHGIVVSAAHNTIGGSGAGEGNILSGNGGDGLLLNSAGNTVKGNKIGIDETGTTGIPNQYHGIEVNAANTIGGTATGETNIISGNNGSGIYIGTANGITVKGNIIGMNAAATAAIANRFYGVEIHSSNNRIGGSSTGEGNNISGNTAHGVNIVAGSGNDIYGNIISGNSSGVYIGTAGNTVKGNMLGASAMPNRYHGIEVNGANNVIGGIAAGEGNAILNNLGNGIHINIGTANSMLGNTISDNSGSGIVINTENNIAKGNRIGMNSTGTAAAPNVYHGIVVGAPHNIIGGSGAGEGNILSGNGGNGLLLNAAGNTVKGNKIGVDETGTTGIPNEYHGIEVNAANTIGGSNTGDGNVISGNNGSGIYIDTAGGISVHGNIIGMNATATAAIPNTYFGIEIHSSNNYIGGSAAGEGNNISGNGSNGVIIYTGTNNSILGNVVSANMGSGVSISSAGNILKGNIVGMDASGTVAMANEPYGIEIYGNGNIIGGSASTDKNIVSGNTVSGIYLGADNNTVTGNIIGMNAAGTTAAANGYYGVHIDGSNNTIGDTTTGAGNIISGNGFYGITVFTGTGNSVRGNILSTNEASGLNFASDANSAYGNIIGMDANGTVAQGNKYAGIEISGSGNHIGGSTQSQRNLISGNIEYGIIVGDGTGNTIKGNYIGTDKSGSTAIANGTCGILINADYTQVGGTGAGEGNLVSGNTVAGVAIFGRHNTLQGNIVGLDATGTTAIGNGEAIMIQNANNIVGGSIAGSRNIISGNNGGAVIIYGTSRDTVQGNYIGVDITGTAIVPNAYEGVVLHYASNTVTSKNTIAGNGTVGVLVSGNGGRNIISANSIYDNGGLGIDLGNDGVTQNDALDTDAGANGLLNFPLITSISQGAGSTTISGTYDGSPSATFTIELFSNATIDSSGYGEGKTYIGNTIVNTDAAGHGIFTATVSGSYNIITATATNSFNSTSEFSGTGPRFAGPAPQSLEACFNAPAKDIKSLLHVSAPQLGQILTWSVVAPPAHGTLTITAATASSGNANITPGGTMTYEPATAYLGTDSFSVQVTDGISYDTLLVRITVHANPVISSIGATTAVCESTPLYVYSTISGAGPFLYSWSGPNGFTSMSEDTLVTLAGTSAANGSYQLIVTDVNNCSDTASTSISLYEIQPVVGPAAVAFGNTITLSNAIPGGTWSTPTPWITKVTATNGNVKGISTGTAQISYTTADGCVATHSVTVYSLVNACVGQTITLSDGTTGGTWASNVGSIATVGLTTGAVTGVSAGKAIIRHFVSPTTIITTTVTVNPLAPISASAAPFCQGQPFTLTNATPGGGTWYSANTAIATISSSGIAVAIGAGAVTIYFTPVAGCATAKTVTITAVTPITGVSDLCVGQTIAVSNSMPGGAWSTSSGALVQITSTGVAKGMAAGTPRISYIWPTGCQSVASLTVKALSPITGGTPGICASNSMTLANATPFGGIWSSSNTNAATVSSSGFVKATGAGSTIISFTTNVGSCVATRTVTVNACREASEETTAIEETTEEIWDVKLYPNPNKGQFTITGIWPSATGDEEVAIEVTDMLGQVIYRNTIKAQNSSLNTPIALQGNLASGMYMLRLYAGNNQKLFRFVVN